MLHPNKIDALTKKLQSLSTGNSDIVIHLYNGDASSMLVDFGDPKGGNIIFGGTFIGTDVLKGVVEQEKLLKTTLYYSFKEDAETGEITIDLKQISNFNNHKVFEYTKDTLLLLPDPTLRDVAKFYMKQTGSDSILMLQKGIARYIVPTPQEIIGKVGEKDLSSMTVAQKVQHEKDNLKVYETPDTVLTSVVRAIDYDGFAALLNDEIGNRVYAVVSAAKANQTKLYQQLGIQGDMPTAVFLKVATEYIGYKMLKSYGHNIHNPLFENEEKFRILYPNSNFKQINRFHEMVFGTGEDDLGDARLISIFNYIERIAKESKEGKNPMATVLADKDAYKDSIGRKLKAENMLIFDPQIGSAAGFMRAVDAVGLGSTIKMWGTELREDIEQSDDRVKIIGGVNTALMASTMSNVFFAKNHSKASSVMLTWNNPPYSLDDGIAKASLDMYKNNTLIMGLYPVKMKNYLKNTLDQRSIIVEIPRSLTGYTDPNTPERFLVVAGRKYTAEAEAREEGREIGGIFSHSTGTLTEASLEEGATQDDLTRVILSHFAENSHIVGTKAMANLDYFHDKDWERENILYAEIKKSAESMKEFYKNAEKFKKIIEGSSTMELFQKTVQPLQIAKTEKVFLDTRYYSESGSYEALRFDEVATNTPLLIHYTKSMPKIMDIIETIAEEKGMKLPIDRKAINTEKFKVGERYKGEKMRVATEKLGMMKFAFYPTDFDIKDPVSRKNILDVIVAVYKDHGRKLNEIELDALDTAMRRSNVLTIKSKRSVTVNSETEEYLVQSQELLVIDNDERSIPLNINNFDFYQKLEEMGFFDINDYIEVVSLSTETKREIIEGFVEYVDNITLEDIASYLGEDKNALVEKTSKRIRELIGKGIRQSEAVTIVNTEVGIRKYVENYFEKTANMSIEKNMKPILEKYFGDIFEIQSKEGRKKLNNYIKTVENVYASDEESFFGSALSIVIEKLKEALVAKYNAQGKSENEIAQLQYKMADFEEEVRLSMTDLEKFVKETSIMAQRLGSTIYFTYASLKNRVEKIKSLEGQHTPEMIAKLYDDSYSIFEKWTRKIASLMEHQIKEPENFTEMQDKRTNFMLKKMRTGKTLTFVYSGILEMFTKKSDIEMYLNSNNIRDIASQLTQHFPLLLPSVAIFADGKKHQFKDDVTHNSLYHTSAVFNPLTVKGLNTQVIGGGAEMERLANNFSKEVEMIEKALDQKYPDGVSIDDLIRDYADSPFVKMLEDAKKMCQEA